MLPKHSGPILAQRDGLTVIDCRACGWAHLDPLPDIPAGYYESEFWATKGAGWLERYEAERDWLDMRHGDWLSVVEEHTDGRTLLDVGSGYGFFLHEGLARGWKCYGIEPSQEAAKYSDHHKNQHIFNGTWENSAVLFDADCISALWLMEHLPNPFEFLAWARAHLAPDGALLLCVPQEWNYLQQFSHQGEKCLPNFWVHPTHLNYWNAATLSNMLGLAGFKVVDALATWPIEFYLTQGYDYTRDEKVGDFVHADIRKNELAMTQSERIQRGRMLAHQSVGRDLVVICK